MCIRDRLMRTKRSSNSRGKIKANEHDESLNDVPNASVLATDNAYNKLKPAQLPV